MYHYDPTIDRFSKIPSQYTKPVTNELYNIIIQEAIELNMNISYYNTFLKIIADRVTIKFYSDIIIIIVIGTSNITGIPHFTNIPYTEYTSIKDLIEKYDVSL